MYSRILAHGTYQWWTIKGNTWVLSPNLKYSIRTDVCWYTSPKSNSFLHPKPLKGLIYPKPLKGLYCLIFMLFKSPLGDLGETIFFLKIKRFKKTPFEKMCYICQTNYKTNGITENRQIE